jgi:TonB family protein
VAAPDYAGHLMDLVRAAAAKRTRWADAPAMAEASDLESRVRALLDRGRNRRPLTRRAALGVAAAACALLLPVAAITAHAQAARGSLAGVVQDASGARVPNCGVTAKSLDGPNQEVATANSAGEYRFASIPPGRYALEFRSRGFAIAKVEATVPAGNVARADAKLEIGQLQEMVTVVGDGARAAAAPAAAGQPERIKVGGNVQPAKLIRQAKPVYPEDLKQLGVEGSVVIRTVISVDGQPLNPEVINTDVHPGLAKAALDAVSQWRYQPTLLNGQPVEVVTTITIEFRLAQGVAYGRG